MLIVYIKASWALKGQTALPKTQKVLKSKALMLIYMCYKTDPEPGSTLGTIWIRILDPLQTSSGYGSMHHEATLIVDPFLESQTMREKMWGNKIQLRKNNFKKFRLELQPIALFCNQCSILKIFKSNFLQLFASWIQIQEA